MMLAAEAGMHAFVRRMVTLNMSTTSVDSNGRTTLHYALMAKENQLEVVKALLFIPEDTEIDAIDEHCKFTYIL